MVAQEVLQRRLEAWNEEHHDWPSEGDSDQLRESSKLILLQLMGEVAQELSIDYCVVTWHLKQNGKA